MLSAIRPELTKELFIHGSVGSLDQAANCYFNVSGHFEEALRADRLEWKG